MGSAAQLVTSAVALLPLLPLQVLSTRARKEVALADVKVQVRVVDVRCCCGGILQRPHTECLPKGCCYQLLHWVVVGAWREQLALREAHCLLCNCSWHCCWGCRAA